VNYRALAGVMLDRSLHSLVNDGGMALRSCTAWAANAPGALPNRTAADWGANRTAEQAVTRHRYESEHTN